MTDRYIERKGFRPANELKPHTPREKQLVRKIREAIERGRAENYSTDKMALWIWQIMKSNGRPS
jgi:hypothetical protein